MQKMIDGVEKRMAGLAALPADRTLDDLEAEVGRHIARLRRDGRQSAALAPVQFAAISLSLLTGILVGGYLASAVPATPRGLLFENVAALAPSALLEGHE